MKNKVLEKYPSSFDALQTAIEEVLVKEILLDYCCKQISSMPRRLQEVIKNKCIRTKY